MTRVELEKRFPERSVENMFHILETDEWTMYRYLRMRIDRWMSVAKRVIPTWNVNDDVKEIESIIRKNKWMQNLANEIWPPRFFDNYCLVRSAEHRMAEYMYVWAITAI